MFSIQTTYTQAQENLASLLDRLESENSMAIITRPGQKDMALLSAEELTGLLETVYLLRSPANARKLLAALERSMERDVQTILGQTVTELRQELGIERQE
ncbi:MAG: prevent-host-death family protein [Microcystis aeruginosa SX13-11]|nr:prevent-host-death family protein [Microcystis aeruginosa SX13-11]